MVFNRYQEKNLATTKPEYYSDAAENTKVYLGFDISGMYLSNLMQDMLTGVYVQRRKCNEEKKERKEESKKSKHGQLATEWITHMERILKVECQHMFNGQEKKCGGRQLPVDGYAKRGEKEHMELSGCYFR